MILCTVKEPLPTEDGVKIAPEKRRSAVVVEISLWSALDDFSLSSAILAVVVVVVEETVAKEAALVGEFIEEEEDDEDDDEDDEDVARAEGSKCKGAVGISSEC